MSTSRVPRPLRITITLAATLFVLADAGLLAIRYSPTVRLATVVALRRNHGCTFARAMRSEQEGQRQLAIRDTLFKSFQWIESDNQGLSLWNTPKGRYWIPKGCERVLSHNLAEQERRIYEAGNVKVKPGDTVLDCGANVGVFTRVALTDGAKLVVAIEPAPENLACLRRTFASEIAAGRVVVYPKGVWDKEDTLTLHVYPHNSARDTFVVDWKDASVQSVTAPLTTIDALVSELKLERVDFIKMDIEGAEKRALAGAAGTLVRFQPQLAVAAEHLSDDGESIPLVVQKLSPRYQAECGPCVDLGSSVTPDVLYFR